MIRYAWTAFFLFSIIAVPTVQGRAIEPHQFSENECRICHLDRDKNPAPLKPVLSSTCAHCHANIVTMLKHPVDIFPATSVPADMPLVDGKLSCITCHFVHPFPTKLKKFSYSLLRRPGRGPSFCSACHGIDEKGHIVFENIHQGSYQTVKWNNPVDIYTLQCMECHDDKVELGTGSFGARHFSSPKSNHSVGVSYSEIAAMNPRKFNPGNVLPKEIRLYNGKIGCGTCHNVYSKEKSMLAMNNAQSRLCIECHNI